MSITAEDLAKRFGGTVAGPSPDELAKKFGGAVQDVAPTAAMQPPTTIGQTPLGALMIGVDSSTFLHRIGGALSTVTNTLFPGGDVRKPDRALPSLTPEEEIGAKTAVVGSAAELPGLALNAGKAALSRFPATQARFVESLDAAAAANKARAIAPGTLQNRFDVGKVAGEASKQGLAKGVLGSTIDRNILADLEQKGQRVATVEQRVAQSALPEMQTAKADILSEIDNAKAKLNIPRTDTTARPEAGKHLDDIRGIVDKLPNYIDPDQLIALRRQLDDRAAEAGAFGANADSLKADLNRGVANVVRSKVNSLDPEMAVANRDYSVARRLADTVERRQLMQTGKIGSGLPGRGSILDDLLATWAGHAMGGPVGGGIAEALNLGRQTRGFANIKSDILQSLADELRPAVPVRKLLGAGNPALPPFVGESSVTGIPMDPPYGAPPPLVGSFGKGPVGKGPSNASELLSPTEQTIKSYFDYIRRSR